MAVVDVGGRRITIRSIDDLPILIDGGVIPPGPITVIDPSPTDEDDTPPGPDLVEDIPRTVRPPQGGLTADEIIALVAAGDLDVNEALTRLTALGVDRSEAERRIEGTGRFVFSRDARPPDPVPRPEPGPVGDVPLPISREEAELARFIEESQTLGGRAGLFNELLQGQLAGFAPAFRRAAEQRFDPLSAAFSLQTGLLDDPASTANFRSFLAGAPQPLSRADFQEQIAALQPLFAQGADPTQFAQAGGPAELRRRFFGGQTGLNIFTQALGAQVPRVLQRGLQDVARRRFSALGGIDPLVGPFTQFIRRGGFR